MANGPKTAGDVMTRNPRTVTPDTPVREAAQLMRSEDTGALPVVDGDSGRPVGVVTDRDLVLRVVAEGNLEARVRDAMTPSPHTVREHDPLSAVMDVMAREQVRRVPIVDERGAVVGIVSQADVVLADGEQKRAEQTVAAISRS